MVKISEILDRHGDSVGSAAVLLSAFGMVEKEVYRLADELDSMTKTASTEARAPKQEEMIKMAGIGKWLAELAGKAGRGLGKWLGKAPSELALTRGLTGIEGESAGKALRSGLNKLEGKTPQIENALKGLAGATDATALNAAGRPAVQDLLAHLPASATQKISADPAIMAGILSKRTTPQQLVNYLGTKGISAEELGLARGGLSNITKGVGAAGLGLAGAGALSSMGKPNTPPYQPTPPGIPGTTTGPGGGYGGSPGGGGEVAAIQSAIGTLNGRLLRVEQRVGLA